MSGERLQTPDLVATDDLDDDRALRPRRLSEFVGQEMIREQLAVSIAAAIKRGDTVDHVLLAGPPGLGKTSLAHIIASEMGAPFTETAGPAIERKGDIASYLSSLEPGAVFFVDEIHRLPRALEEMFYSAMEDGKMSFNVGQGAGARPVTLTLPPFTLIGATTQKGLLSGPLRDRFGIQHQLEAYSPEQLTRIVRRSARLLEVTIEDDGAVAIALRSRGTPRLANGLLRNVRDYAQVRHSGVVTAAIAHEALDWLEVDQLGLERLHRKLLHAICDTFSGGPVGLSTLAIAVDEDRGTVEDVHERYLLQCGLIERTPRGRVATRRAYEHLGLPVPEQTLQATLL